MSDGRLVVASIPEAYRRQGISWLAIDKCPEGGWFLFMHTELDEPCTFDSWHEDKEGCLKEAENSWGVGAKDWKAGPCTT